MCGQTVAIGSSGPTGSLHTGRTVPCTQVLVRTGTGTAPENRHRFGNVFVDICINRDINKRAIIHINQTNTLKGHPNVCRTWPPTQTFFICLSMASVVALLSPKLRQDTNQLDLLDTRNSESPILRASF